MCFCYFNSMRLNKKQIENELEDKSNLHTHTTNGHIELSKDGSNIKEIHYKEGRAYHNVYGRIERFIHKNVDRPYCDVFSDFKKMVDNDKSLLRFCRNWGESLSSLFNDHIDMDDDSSTYVYKNDHFYLDNDGIIRNMYKDMPAHHKDKIFVETGVTYKWPSELQKFVPELIGILTKYLNYTAIDAKHIATETISKKELDNLKVRYNRSYKVTIVWSDLRKRIIDYCRYNHYYHIYYYSYGGIDGVFSKITDGYYITKTKNKRIQNRAESLDKKNKMSREEKKSKIEYNETLLHILTEKKRLLERKENLIKVQAHGMSDTESFRGEEYHGQKRKKK